MLHVIFLPNTNTSAIFDHVLAPIPTIGEKSKVHTKEIVIDTSKDEYIGGPLPVAP
jgi:hypothetical protein